MGNKPFRIALKVDELQYEAGQVVKGRVYLSVDKEESLRGCTGIHLSLEGYEHVEIVLPNDEHDYDRRVKCREDRVDRSINALVRTDYPIVCAKELKVGQFEYPFQWRLPSDLPSSMHCKKKGSNSFAEIRYTLSAYLVTSRRDVEQDTLPRADMALCITAKPSSSPPQAVLMDVERFPINSCFFWNKGSMEMGWQIDADVGSPGETLSVQVVGENHSRLKVESVRVKLVETVAWSTNSKKRRNVSRTLAEQSISTRQLAWWQPWYHPQPADHATYNSLGSSERHPLSALLGVPADARDSYSGRLLNVRHVVVVSAETKGCTNTSPESTCQVHIARAGTGRTEEAVRAVDIPEAQVVSTDWGPIVGDAVAIPEAAVVLMDEDLATDARTAAVLRNPTQQGPNPVSLRASAPDEALVAASDHEREDSFRSGPNLEQLLALVGESPENLEAVLQDAAWATLAQNLSPREYCAVVQAAGEKAPSVAHTLGLTMRPRLECRHLLACLWTLPDCQRIEVIRRAAPLVSDLDANQQLLEHEMSPKELVHFRAALHCR